MTDTLFVSNVNYRTLLGSTITTSTMTVSSITVSTMTASTIFSATGQTALGNNVTYPNRFVEVGSDTANSIYLDFHSSDAALPDYSTRIQSLGGATSGTGNLNMYASTIGLMPTVGVGIGTTVPSAALHVYGSSGLSLATTGTVNYTNTSILGFGFGGGSSGTRDSFRIISQPVNRDNGAGTTFYDYGAQADLVFLRKTNNLFSAGANDMTYTEVMRIHGAYGFVGIGTYSPATPLHVFSPSTGHPGIIRINTTISSFGSSANGGRLEWYGTYTGNGGSYFQAAIQAVDDVSGDSSYGGLAFRTRNNTTEQESMRISSVGNVGIGITNPTAALQVNGAINSINTSLTVTTSATNLYTVTSGQSGWLFLRWGNGNSLYFFQWYNGVNSSSIMQIYNVAAANSVTPAIPSNTITLVSNTSLTVYYTITFMT